jgi:60 kDa SS-A/Ro ribonucleoprotein
MSRFHGPKVDKTLEASHQNWMGGRSWDISSPLTRLRIAASSCFFGEPMYYQRDPEDKRKGRSDGSSHAPLSRLTGERLAHLRETLNAVDPQEWRSMSPSELMEKAIDDALEAEPEQTLQFAGELRSKLHIRTTPQVILVRAAHHPKVRGTGLVRKYAPEILKRADEPSVGLAYQLWRYKDKPVPNSLKKAWADFLAKSKEYHLAKYRMEGRAVKTVDVVNLVHPKSEAVSKLVKGELTVTDKTWEAIISAEGSTKEAWEKALEVMGHPALLKNLRNLLEKKVDPKAFLDKLVEGAKTGQQLPFRYYSAYRAIKPHAPGNVLDAVEECLNISLGELPLFKGRLMALCDNSGSAHNTTTSSMGTMKISTIANLTAVLAAMRAEDGHVGIFGDELKTFAARKTSSVFDQLNEAEKLGADIGGATENGIWLFLDKAIKKEEHWDHIFVFSDQQAGHGGLYGTNCSEYSAYAWESRYIDVAKLIRTYRSKVNSKVNVFLVQVAGYQDTIVPEYYDRTYILGGWSSALLQFAGMMCELADPPPMNENFAGGYRDNAIAT